MRRRDVKRGKGSTDGEDGAGREAPQHHSAALAAHLSAEDRALWEHAARSIHPIKGVKPRVHGALEGHGAEMRAGRQQLHAEPRVLSRGQGGAHGGSAPQPVPRKRPSPPPPVAEFDRRKARRIASGREEIEARIDLHGMKQAQAHTALRSFLFGCHVRGLTTVLVITGKGSGGSFQDAGDEPGWLGGRERGALKRNVPHWLAEPELRAIVVSHRPAGARHGGDGALYVQLRRRRAHAP